MMNRSFFLLFLLFGLASAMVHLLCMHYKAFETDYECGATGYFLADGWPYCYRFTRSMIDKFDSTGKEFIGCTIPCMVNSLRGYLKKNDIHSCSQIADAAYEQRVHCYAACDFCTAWLTNTDAFMSVYDVGDISTFASLKDVGGILNGCTDGTLE
ncbi:hypothetical protein M3Y99_00441700 [Aphelenchoides fujianensis]|nr:hypothetical protein M3Y99_00441700 [Aphelenchoides fujianensis]